MQKANPTLTPGMIVLHSNRQEDLRSLVVDWLAKHPLGVLETEQFLVQSQGIGQWLKLALAQDSGPGHTGLGIASNLRMVLPSQFLWEVYRAVLGSEQIPQRSPYDKAPLSWRILRLLDELPEKPEFSALRTYLGEAHSVEKRYAMAKRLADLFDQYQIYRADWLTDWSKGRDRLVDGRGGFSDLPSNQFWQPALWRAIRSDLGAFAATSRADLHSQFLERLARENRLDSGLFRDSEPVTDLPRRVVVFGVSSLPVNLIDALSAISSRMQVILCVLNPCRHYWADLVEGRDLLRLNQHRIQQRAQTGSEIPDQLGEDQLHLHVSPLLASWGKQGRDYLALLDELEEQNAGNPNLFIQRTELYDAEGAQQRTLLQHLQWDIQELIVPSAEPAICLDSEDDSLSFTGAHSPLREVEILQDQLIDALAKDQTLTPRDLLVMASDIEPYRAAIQSVFGRIDPQDTRYIPFTLNDHRGTAQSAELSALRYLLSLNQQRLTASELFELLELPLIQKRFSLDEQDLDRLQLLITESGVRWGLNGAHRQGFGLVVSQEQNSWIFGINRLILGYLAGEGEQFAGVQSLGISVSSATSCLGSLSRLLDQLCWLLDLTQRSLTLDAWYPVLIEFLDRFFDGESEQGYRLRTTLIETLQQLRTDAAAAELEEALPLSLVARAWLEPLEQSSPRSIFISGGLTFATLMPMRAIPYRRIYLLGMNEGAYPRVSDREDLDLMSDPKQFRPGDRSRREDDRYLFLEALLSARDHLSISWVARNIRDNQEQPPSVLVAQLRDYISQRFRASTEVASGSGAQAGEITDAVNNGRTESEIESQILSKLTTLHPLQPFSDRYFTNSSDSVESTVRQKAQLFSYAHEWCLSETQTQTQTQAQTTPPARIERQEFPDEETVVNLSDLIRLLSRPASVFTRAKLGTELLSPREALVDTELLALQGLDRYLVAQRLIEELIAIPPDAVELELERQIAQLAEEGVLPWDAGGKQAGEELRGLVQSILKHRHVLTGPNWHLAPTQRVSLAVDHWQIESEIGPMLNQGRHWHAALATPSALVDRDLPRYDRLARAWPTHLIVSQHLGSIQTTLSGPDHSLVVDPMAAADASQQLRQLLKIYERATHQPLPLALRTGVALAVGDFERARLAYEGSNFQPGELQQQDELRRFYPDFDSLLGADALSLAQALYGPLCAQVRIAELAEAPQ